MFDLKNLKIGDYVSVEGNSKVLYKVLDIKIHENGQGYFLYYKEEWREKFWDRFEYIEKVFEVKEKDKSE